LALPLNCWRCLFSVHRGLLFWLPAVYVFLDFLCHPLMHAPFPVVLFLPKLLGRGFQPRLKMSSPFFRVPPVSVRPSQVAPFPPPELLTHPKPLGIEDLMSPILSLPHFFNLILFFVRCVLSCMQSHGPDFPPSPTSERFPRVFPAFKTPPFGLVLDVPSAPLFFPRVTPSSGSLLFQKTLSSLPCNPLPFYVPEELCKLYSFSLPRLSFPPFLPQFATGSPLAPVRSPGRVPNFIPQCDNFPTPLPPSSPRVTYRRAPFPRTRSFLFALATDHTRCLLASYYWAKFPLGLIWVGPTFLRKS